MHQGGLKHTRNCCFQINKRCILTNINEEEMNLLYRPYIWCVGWNVVFSSWIKIIFCSGHWGSYPLVFTPLIKIYIIVINILKKKSSMCHLNKFKDMFRTWVPTTSGYISLLVSPHWTHSISTGRSDNRTEGRQSSPAPFSSRNLSLILKSDVKYWKRIC